MRIACLTLTAALLAADDANRELEKFQGDWVITAYTVDGKPAAADVLKTIKLNVKGNVSTFTIEGVTAMGAYRLDPGKQPAWLDIAVTSGKEKGTTRLGIYQFQDGTLRICHSGKERPREFASQPGSGHVLEVWKKAP